LEAIVVRDTDSGATERLEVAALLALITPRTEWLRGAIALDEWGYVLTGGSAPPGSGVWSSRPFESSVHGVFAVGDVRRGSVKRVASAVGEGSVVVQTVHE
jgi:thioredoxin reductase (NADPH)